MISNTVKAIIVDDEKTARFLLFELLKEIEGVEVVGSYAGVDEAVAVILKQEPDIVFLDVQMPGKNGFELLHEIKDFDVDPTIIFITAYDEFAIEAIRHSAFDYITKPIDPALLSKSIKRYKSEKADTDKKENISKLLNYILPNKIRFNTRSGAIFINPKEIVYLQAERNYTNIFISTGQCHTVSLYLSEVHEKLPPALFLKVSRSAFINLEFITKLDRKKRLVFLKAEGKQYQLKVGLKYLKVFERFGG
ncbi:MAG: LytTR family DNA-binding domain-containing protein [Bacteroidales bacterium]|nr:LytTR family DNA-binding domain-containing protein [Bacteroidales bacterium]MCF6342106.1 LytTR family DNA-binding domain-containing protein [Bacteroidales bacterium]